MKELLSLLKDLSSSENVQNIEAVVALVGKIIDMADRIKGDVQKN